MRLPLSLSLLGLAVLLAALLAGTALARQSRQPDSGSSVRALRIAVDHYRTLAWTFERAAHIRRIPSSFSDRRTTDTAYLRWTVETWTRRAYSARNAALARIHRRFAVAIPHGPAPRSGLATRVSYSRRVALKLRRIYPGIVTRRFAEAHAGSGAATLLLWQKRLADAALGLLLHGRARPRLPRFLTSALLCIHHYEGGWDANTGNGYYGGLQMDLGFQRLYGGDYFRRWGTADRWPPWAQLEAAARAYQAGRGFAPWPSTARACGLR